MFDNVADKRREPNFNTRVSRVELLTPGPIGNGSQFRAKLTMMRRVFDVTVEFTAFEHVGAENPARCDRIVGLRLCRHDAATKLPSPAFHRLALRSGSRPRS